MMLYINFYALNINMHVGHRFHLYWFFLFILPIRDKTYLELDQFITK